ncbi:MAG: YkgJ family cysteine cluster protein [Clostridia bacterium]|nr:YkgJ family cysteine cluster protein [Clostridia bacterium]
MECRVGCGACCIALSISSPIPGMQGGKPAGTRCIQLTQDNKCKLFGKPERPDVCRNLKPSRDFCKETDEAAYEYLVYLEAVTKPDKPG